MLFGDGRVVHGVDRDRDGGSVAVHSAVVDLEGEAVGAEVVLVGRVSEIRRRAAQEAVCGLREHFVCQGVAIDVVCDQRYLYGCVFVGRDRLLFGDWRVVHGVDRNRDRRGVRASVAVAHGVCE